MLRYSIVPSRWWLILAVVAASSLTSAQFTCTFTASDENSCLGATSDDGDHCVWCSVSGLGGFCVSEKQAESMEANVPGIQCDRYSSTDDDEAPTDDKVDPGNDDAAPSPNDDALPDDYWTCLKKKDSKSCAEEGCTWCESKAGFGLCLTGTYLIKIDLSRNSSFVRLILNTMLIIFAWTCLQVLGKNAKKGQHGCTLGNQFYNGFCSVSHSLPMLSSLLDLL